MKTTFLTIDTGTTNTRISIVSDGKILNVLKLKVGAVDTKKDPRILFNKINLGIKEILSQNRLSENDIECIIACGMITSELGICNLEHIKAPCGIAELASSLHHTVIPEISNLPFFFVRGVMLDGDTFETTDFMRGEETELFGLTDCIETDCLYVLPGSHSKLILTDDKGRIVRFTTELTGELMSAVTSGTILNQNIDLTVDVEIDRKYLTMGYQYAKAHGLNAAFFKVRILNNVFGCTRPQIYGFFKGVALCPEIENIRKIGAKKVIIAGKAQLKDPMCYLLTEFSDKEIFSVPDEIADNATAIGMVKIYNAMKEDNNGKAL